MSVVLGVHGYSGPAHDAGAALIVDGTVVAAVEEERLNRIKRSIGCWPERSIREVLQLGSLRASDVDLIAFPWDPRLAVADGQEISRVVKSWLGQGPLPPVRFVAHHEAHAFCGLAYLPGGLRGNEARVLVLDGSGESTSGGVYHWSGAELTVASTIPMLSSIGIYYEALSSFVGFRFGEEGKTMGLASYGRPRTLPIPVPSLALSPGPPRPRGEGYISHNEAVAAASASFFQSMRQPATFNDRADVAFTGQAAAAQAARHIVASLDLPTPHLVLSGGFALNCKINAALAADLSPRGIQLTVPPAAGDSGLALGAAIAASAMNREMIPPPGAYLGRMADSGAVCSALAALDAPPTRCTIEEIADRIADGAIFGWFVGRAEIGPRALGHRAIIARANSEFTRDRINALKGRESWRPLAPSMTVRETGRSLDGQPSPFMLHAASVKEHALPALAGVAHVDGTTRPQLVTDGGPFHQLILAVGAITGCEAVICTSFNMSGEPIVYTADDALRSASAMKLDGIAGDGWLLRLGNPR